MNPQSTLKQAALCLEQNNHQNAIKLAKQVLKHEPGSTHAMYIYAIANAQTNNKKAALDTFGELIKQMPNNSDIHYNHGMVLAMFDSNEKAIKAFQKTLDLNPKHTFAHISLGNIFNQKAEYNLAIQAYLSALDNNPHNPGLLDNLIQSYFKNQQFNSCLKYIGHLRQLQQLGLNQLNLEVQCYMQLGNYRAADRLAVLLAESHQESIFGNYYHGLCSQKLMRYPVAIKAYKKVLNQDNRHTDSLKNLAICYSYSAQYTATKNIVKQLYSLNSNKLDTLVFDFTLREMNNELTASDEDLIAAVQANRNHPNLFVLHAKALIAASMYKQATHVLSDPPKSLPTSIHAETLFLLADAYDKAQEYDKAWQTYTHANALIHSDTSDPFNKKLSTLIPQLQNIEKQQKQEPSVSDEIKPIFIIGFPRSGTTLIDSILSSQKESIVLEETPLIADLADKILGKQSFDCYIQTLNNLTPAEIKSLRKEYFDRIPLYHKWSSHQTIIDKSPLNLIHTLLIHKIFPESPIICAIRHPLDVCISCYMQNFRANPELITAFSSTDSIATTYQNLMTVWQQIDRLVNLNQLIVRYEDMINQTEQQVKELVKFVGLPWSDKYLEFHTTVKNRGMIHNPSYNQVNQKIYNTKMFRHTKYADHIEVLQEATASWIEALGY